MPFLALAGAFLKPVADFLFQPRVLIVIAAVSLLGVIYWRDREQTAAIAAQAGEITRLEGELSGANARLRAVETQQEAQGKVNEVFDQRLEERAAFDRSISGVIREIDRAPPEANGPVAPVLRDTQRRLNGLRDEARARYPD